MRKYYYIFKSEIMSSLQYIFNIVLNFIVFSLFIFVFMCLWKYIYSDPSELINGYNMYQMMWYLIGTETLYTVLSGRKFCRRISEDVKGGNISYNLNKPYSYLGYCLSSHLGEIAIKGFIYIACSIAMGLLFMHQFPELTIFSAIAVLISFALSYMISSTFIICIGLLAFFVENSLPFYWIYSKTILVFGTLFPIEFFPAIIQPFIRYSLIYAVSYGPANLFVDFGWNKFFIVIGAQLIYLAVAFGIATLLYRKGVKKLNVNGG